MEEPLQKPFFQTRLDKIEDRLDTLEQQRLEDKVVEALDRLVQTVADGNKAIARAIRESKGDMTLAEEQAAQRKVDRDNTALEKELKDLNKASTIKTESGK